MHTRMKLMGLLLFALGIASSEGRVRFETNRLDDQLIGSYVVDRSDDEGDTGSGGGGGGSDSDEDDNDVMLLPPGIQDVAGDRDIMMEGEDPLPTEWTHINDNNEMDTLHLPPSDDGNDRSIAKEPSSLKVQIFEGPADRMNNNGEDYLQHDVLRLPSHVAQLDNSADREWQSAADRNLPSASCLKIKIVYGSGFLNLFGGSQASARAAIVQMVKDTNVRFKSGNYPGLNTDITVDVLKIEYLSTAPNAATGSDLQGSALRGYINADPERASVHHYAFLAPGGPDGVIGIAWLGTTCLSGTTYAYYKASINEHYTSEPTLNADVLAHEMGHALGMDHDFTKRNGVRVGYWLRYSNGTRVPCMNIGGIMDYTSNRNKWSPCSNYFLNRYMNGKYCLSWPASGQCNSGWANSDSSAATTTTTTPAPSSDCDQVGSDAYCTSKSGQCSTSNFVKTYCRKTCNNCNECSDYSSTSCPNLPELYCYDGVYNSYYKNYRCIKRCQGCIGDSGIAKPASQTGCTQYQSSNYCSQFRPGQPNHNKCSSSPTVMIGCRNDCQTCGVCSDLATNCNRFLSLCGRYSFMDNYYCIKSCGNC